VWSPARGAGDHTRDGPATSARLCRVRVLRVWSGRHTFLSGLKDPDVVQHLPGLAATGVGSSPTVEKGAGPGSTARRVPARPGG